MPEIWLPPGFTKKVVDRCKVPTPDGPCGHEFYEGESELRRVAHLKECADRNLETIVATRKKAHPDVMKPWDPEYAEWLDDHAEGIAAGTVRW